MEGLTEGNDLVLVGPVLVMGPTTRQLQRGLVGLATGRAQIDLVGEGTLGQLPGQLQCRLVGVDVGQVPQLVGLGLEGLDQDRVAVTQRVHRDAAGEVDVLAAFLIPQTAAFAAHRDDLLRSVVGHHVLVEVGTARGMAHRGSPLWLALPVVGRERAVCALLQSMKWIDASSIGTPSLHGFQQWDPLFHKALSLRPALAPSS